MRPRFRSIAGRRQWMEDGDTFLSAVVGHVAGFDLRSRCANHSELQFSEVLIGRERRNVLAATMVASVTSYCEAQRLSSFFARQVGQTRSICAFEVPRLCGSMLPSTLIRRVVCRLVSTVHEIVPRETMRYERVFQIFLAFQLESGRAVASDVADIALQSQDLSHTVCTRVTRVLRHAASFFCCVPAASPLGRVTRPATSGHFLVRPWTTKTNIRIDGLVIGNRRPLEVDPPED